MVGSGYDLSREVCDGSVFGAVQFGGSLFNELFYFIRDLGRFRFRVAATNDIFGSFG